MIWQFGFRKAVSIVLSAALVSGPAMACDFCLRLPNVPFELNQLVAIEVAMATQDAAANELIDLNPSVTIIDAAGRSRSTELKHVSPRQLVGQWLKIHRSKVSPTTRCSVELVFVDVDQSYWLDVRGGTVLEGTPDGPADVRVILTKAGFHRLLEVGLLACERQQLVVVESAESHHGDLLAQLFGKQAKSTGVDVAMRK